MIFPQMYRIRQKFDNTTINDIRKEVLEQLSRLPWNQIQPGHRVAIAAGSRGIANFADILKAIVEFLKSLDARPFIFPAMGSHGRDDERPGTHLLKMLDSSSQDDVHIGDAATSRRQSDGLAPLNALAQRKAG